MRKSHFIQILFTIALVFGASGLMAQNASDASELSPVTRWFYDNMLIVIGGLVVIAAFYTLIYLNQLLLKIQKIKVMQEHGLEVAQELGLMKKESWWTRINKQAWSLIPIEKEKDIMFDHEYDGIRELDNVLPPWWVWTFYLTIAFGIGYLAYFHVAGAGLNSQEEYELEMAQAEESVKIYLSQQADLVDETNVTALTEEADLASGQSVYITNCAVCHGQLGEGGTGPNLTDDYYLHGGDIKSVFKTIKYGVPEKGMISWKAQLRTSQMHQVASYLLTLRGTNPPNPKDPEGELYEPDAELAEVAPAEEAPTEETPTEEATDSDEE